MTNICNILRSATSRTIMTVIILLTTTLSGMAQVEYKAVLNANTDVIGAGAQGHFALKDGVRLITGMSFDLTFDVSTNGNSFNQWGSCLFATGTNPIATTYPGGFQLYLRSSTNNGKLVVKIGAGESFFGNIAYNRNFSVHIVYNASTTTLSFTATDTESHAEERKDFAVTSIDIANFCYALPVGLDIRNLNLTIKASDVQPLSYALVAKIPDDKRIVGAPLPEIVTLMKKNVVSDDEALQQYEAYLACIDKRIELVMPESHKVYFINSYVDRAATKKAWLKEKDSSMGVDHHGEFEMSTDDPITTYTGEYFYKRFPYMWVPLQELDNENNFRFMIGTGGTTNYYLSNTSNGLERLESPLDATTLFTVEEGKLGYGYVSLKNDANYATGSASYSGQPCFGTYPSGTAKGFIAEKAQESNYSTDFQLEEVEGVSRYKVIITKDSDSSVNISNVCLKYINGTFDAEISNEGAFLPVGVVERSQLSAIYKDPKGGVAEEHIITITPSEIHILFVEFTSIYNAFKAELGNIKDRIATSYGSFYTAANITTAEREADEAKADYDAAKDANNTEGVRAAINKLSDAKEKFYRTAEGKYVLISSGNDKYVTSTGNTNLSITSMKKGIDKYHAVYKLRYSGDGTYELENISNQTWIGQTTSETDIINSCTNKVDERWRGFLRLSLVGTRLSNAKAYNIVCTNGTSTNFSYKPNSGGTGIEKLSGTTADDANLWDIRPVDIHTYADLYLAYMDKVGAGLNEYHEDNAGSYSSLGEVLRTGYNTKEITKIESQLRDLVAVFNVLQINRPTTKHFYRIYSLSEGETAVEAKTTTNRHYLTAATSGAGIITVSPQSVTDGKPTFNYSTDVTGTLFYYDGTYLLNYRTGKFIKLNADKYEQCPIGNKVQLTFANTEYEGVGAYSITYQGSNYLCNNTAIKAKTGTLINANDGYDARCEWFLEEMEESIPVTIPALGYATLCSPVALSVPDAVTAYTMSEASATEVTLTDIGNNIPAETPVVICGASRTYNFEFSDTGNDGTFAAGSFTTGYVISGGNELRGTLPAWGNDDLTGKTNFTLQKPSGYPVGFYGYTGETFSPFRAYFHIDPPSPSPSKGFTLKFEDSTGISQIENGELENENGAMYNLAGQRVNAAHKGIVIINGRKYSTNVRYINK